jgi:hypothetical protein
LSYLVRAPVSKEFDLPNQVKLHGTWSLTKDHNLCLSLNKWGRQTFGDKLTLQGSIIDVRKNSLLFAVTTKTKHNTKSIYVLELDGAWAADKHNRLTFRVQKEGEKNDILIFRGAWEINEHHQIVYSYEKSLLVRKQKRIHALIFNGYWDIKDRNRLYYVIDKRSDSTFAFKTGLGIFKGKYIKYKVGISVSGRKEPVTRTVTLDGAWRITNGLGLTFEVDYENKKMHAIVFGAEAELVTRDKISFRLRNELNKKIGGELKISPALLKGDGEAFLRFLKSKPESAIFFGVGFRW